MTIAASSSLSTFPLTTAQKLLWLGQKLVSDSPLYNMTFLFTLSGEIEPAHFQAAFRALVERCDVFRLVIEERDGIPQQRVLEAAQMASQSEVLLLDLSQIVEPQVALRAWAREQSQRPFDLAEKLFDTALIRLGDDCWAWYLNQHHLMTDIESVKLVYQQMGELYQRSQAGTLADAAALPAYTEISLPAPTRRAIQYWQKPQTCAVELYQRSKSHVSPQTRRVFYELSPEKTKALKALAIASEAAALTPQLSLFNLIAGLLLAYLHRISGQSKVAFATPAHGRPTASLKETIGVLIELFPLQVKISENETFASLLTQVNAASGKLLRHAQAGTSELALNQSGREVNVVLNFIPTQLPSFAGYPVRSEWVHPGAGDPRHHLRLQVHDFDDRGCLQLHFDWNCDLFEPALQERATQHFSALMDAVLADRHRAIAQVNLLPSDESQQLLTLGNAFTQASDPAIVEQPANDTVLELFHQQVKQRPDAIAVVYENTTLTYQQLNCKANQLAQALRQRGVTAELPVGICLRRSPQMLIAIWAILKAGGAYVPLDPSHPTERIAHILHDTQAHWVLTETELRDRLTTENIDAILLDQLDLSQQSDQTPELLATPGQLAYLLYTSGSTGNPKGVEIEHGNLLNYVQWAEKQYVRGRILSFPLFSPLTFDLTVTSIYVPLISGGQVVVYPESEGEIDLALQRIIQEDQVDVIKLTPSHLALLQGMTLGTRLKTLILGGEDLKTALAGAIATQASSRTGSQPLEIYNEYGPTEATVGCMIQPFQPQDNAPISVSIGKPAANSEIYLLDEHFNLVPQGAVGEIFIGGPGLARGYLNRPELTQSRFVEHKLHGQLRRLYRTGDLGRWLENDQLAYLGRSDRQVKIHGTRIELGEVEALLARHPAVSEAAVTLVQQRPKIVSTEASLSYCKRCGIASNYPGVQFDSQGVCDICHTYETYRDRTEQYFKSMKDLRSQLEAARQRKQGKYDCMMLLSGGKDSTYALAQLVDMGFKVFAFTLDNGYISEEAKANIRRVVKTLEVDHQFGSTPAMNEIFVDSLNRFCNVCNGCFKTIYTLSLKLAYEQGIPCIVTGLSRGQFFETRLTEEWFTELFGQETFEADQIDQTILEARKAYHRTDDAVSRLMDVELFKEDDVFEQVEILDFYRYCDVELAEMLDFLRDQVPWIRPSDTGRSTNCLINNVGIHVHQQTRGYHNYALPYSWDVRMGHKTAEAAIAELNDEIDLNEVKHILREIGYGEINQTQLAAYTVGSVSGAELRTFLAQKLPKNLVPAYFVPLEKMPLTANGKVNFSALPDPQTSRPALQSEFIAPQSDVEKRLAQFWQQVLKVDRIGIHDNFFELGGDSIMAIQIAARMSEAGLVLSPNQLFQYPTLAQLAATVMPEVETATTPVTGLVPLTPIQAAFFEQQPPEPEQFTQTVVLEISEPLEHSTLEQALTVLREHHDSLRLSYKQTNTGWEQRYQDVAPDVKLISVDLSTHSSVLQKEKIAATQAVLSTQLNLAQGDLLRAALVNLSDRQHLIITIHHLAVDAVSWLTLLKDLETAYQQLKNGKLPLLPWKSSSFQTWARALQQVSVPQAEKEYWLKPAAELARLEAQAQSYDLTQTLSHQLSDEQTQVLLRRSDHPQELILSALALAIQLETGQSSVCIDLEGHGREEASVQTLTDQTSESAIRLARTVGWFTSLFPVALTADVDAATTLHSVKTVLNQVPQNGIGYGILRYGADQALSQQLQEQPKSEILFNYLGQFEQMIHPNSIFKFAEPLQVFRSPKQQRLHPLDITAFIHRDQLHLDWAYAGIDTEVIKRIAQRTRQYLQEFLTQETQKIAEDFPLANLNRQKLDKLTALLNKADGSQRQRTSRRRNRQKSPKLEQGLEERLDQRPGQSADDSSLNNSGGAS